MDKKKNLIRYIVISIIFIIMFLALCFKLADLQIVKGEEYRRLAQDKSIRTVDDDAPRGKILDRNMVELATEKQSYTIYMMKPQSNQDDKELNQVIEKLLDIINSRNEKINDDFCIIAKADENGKYIFSFDFPNNYTDEKDIQDYIKRASQQWEKENEIDENYSAEEAFNYLKDKVYHISPEESKDNNIEFIRQMMVVRQMIHDKGYMAYKPVEIAYVSRDTAFEIMERGMDLPGVDYKLKPLRVYPFGDLASLVIGSLRKIPSDKADYYNDRQYDVNTDLIGRDGIEAYAEEDLRGDKGGRTVKVDALGRVVEELGKRDPIPGNNVVLTLDKDLQQVAEQSLDDVMKKLQTGEISGRKTVYPYATRGAAVVIDVKTGEVLAMASRPGGYDPNVMASTGSIDYSTWDKLNPSLDDFSDTNMDNERIPKAMFNYATQGAVPPGSTFKMVTSIAALETGEITPVEKIYDYGQYRVVPNFPGNCWIWNYYHGSHGWVNVTDALKVSCNYFFFELGHRVGLDGLAKYAKMFGLDKEPTGIEIPESPGDVANPEAAKQRAVSYSIMATLQKITEPGYDPKIGTFIPTKEQEELIRDMIANNDRSYNKLKAAGITSSKIRDRIIEGVRAAYNDYNNEWMSLNAAIGQGDDRFTPLQIAAYVTTIANGGTRYKPHLVKEILGPDGKVVEEVQPEILSKVNLQPSTLTAVIGGMDAVTGEGGTAGATFDGFQIKTAGKTGTAQASGGHDDYSWFAGFAPADNPQIAVAVVIYEGGGYGSANVAKSIYEHYFKLDVPASEPVTP